MLIMRPLQTNNPFRKYIIATMGDSQTELKTAGGYGVPIYNAWNPKLISMLFEQYGCLVKDKTWGRSGDSTAEMLGRFDIMLADGNPTIGIIYGGVNDPLRGITGTSVTGTSNTITFDTNASVNINAYLGQVITITSGTGNGQTNTIIGYTSAKVATVKNNWSVTPDATSVYSVAIPDSTTMQSIQQAMIKALKYNVRGNATGGLVHVWSQTQLPAGGRIGQRYIVMEDSSNTGGVTNIISGMHATITGDYSASIKQSVWEFRNPLTGDKGWGRVAIAGTTLFAEGTPYIFTMGAAYLNYGTGGDNYNTNTSTGTQFTQNVAPRAAAKAAALAEGTNYIDLYDYESKLINGGTYEGVTVASEVVQGDALFHWTQTTPFNQHYSEYGHYVTAKAALFKIISDSGLLTALRS